jgi:hypothetical protein
VVRVLKMYTSDTGNCTLSQGLVDLGYACEPREGSMVQPIVTNYLEMAFPMMVPPMSLHLLLRSLNK